VTASKINRKKVKDIEKNIEEECMREREYEIFTNE
jgi:hypothetical protein